MINILIRYFVKKTLYRKTTNTFYFEKTVSYLYAEFEWKIQRYKINFVAKSRRDSFQFLFFVPHGRNLRNREFKKFSSMYTPNLSEIKLYYDFLAESKCTYNISTR